MFDDGIANACPDGILIVDRDGRITGLNDAARRMFGWPGDSLIGQRVNVLVPQARRNRHTRLIRQWRYTACAQQHIAGWRVVVAQRRDGMHFPVNIRLTAMQTDGGWHTIAYVHDMSQLTASQSAAAAAESELAAKQEQNALLAQVAEHATDCVVITDAAGKAIWVNQATERLTGYAAAEFVGRNPGDLLNGPETDMDTVNRIAQAIEVGDSIRCEMLHYRKNGESYWIEINITPIRDGDGRLTKFIAVARDVTAKKNQEAALERAKREAERAESRLASAIEATSEGFVIYDADDRLVMCNSAFREQFSFLQDLLVPGIKFADLTYAAAHGGYIDLEGEDPDTWVRNMVERRRNNDHIETIMRLADGRWMLRRERRTPTGEMIGVRSDITALKQHEESLREAKRKAERAEGRLHSAIEAISEGFVIYDEYDRLVMANTAYKEMRSEDADMIVPGVTFRELVSTAVARGHFDTDGEDPETWVEKQVEQRKTGTNVETMVRFTDGRWMLRRERRTPQGEMIGIRSDITSFKQQEAALQEARAKAEAADQAKSDFVANISHELRTPINGIMGFTQLMLAGELTDKQRERAEIIMASSEHLLQVVNDLLDLSRIASNSVELDPELVDVAELVNETIGLLRPLATEKNLSLTAGIELPPQARIEADRARIKQILLNLIANAINFTSEGGVTLAVSASEDGIAFEVSDTGPGMPEDKIQSIFDRFTRIAGSNSTTGGAGLGLTITKGLAELMGGNIVVRSELGCGSAFTVHLPFKVLTPGNPERPAGSRKNACPSEETSNV